MSVGALTGVSSRAGVWGRCAAFLSLARARFGATQAEISMDQEDLLYADGFASGERGEGWAPGELDAIRREIWTEGYRDGRHGRTGTGRPAMGRLAVPA